MATQPGRNSNLNPSETLVELEGVSSMEALLEAAGAKNLAENTIIDGRIVEKRDNGVLVDIGYKAEGFIPREEFANWAAVEIGQHVDVFLEEVEDEDSMPVISVKKAELQKSWDNLVHNHAEGSVVTGTVRHRVKGGLIVDVGVDAFLPGSQVDLGPVRNLEDYVNRDFQFKILKINPERRNIVVSRRELLEQERAGQRAALLEDLEPNQVRTGIVKNITDFGAFIDLNGLDGLLHITDMSWGRISHPSEIVKVGDEIEVMVLDVDRDRQRVSLGLKQREGNPWDTVDVKFPIGNRIKGRVVNVMPYGAFIELEEGVEGLIHVSEMSWTKRINKASEVVQSGDEVEAVVLDVQKDARKISLGLRQTMENPWELIAEKFPRGSKIKGKVRNMTSYGAFVQIQDDIDGMVHVSDMSWTRKINHPSEVLQKGDEVEAVILDIDPSQQRISLGIKQLAEDPWANIEEHFRVDDVVEGKISKLASFGAFVELSNGIDGLIHISQLSEDRIERVKDVVKVGDVVTARVVKIDQAERRIGLSLKSADEYEEVVPAAGPRRAESALRPGEAMVDMGNVLDDALARFSDQEKARNESLAAAAADDDDDDIAEDDDIADDDDDIAEDESEEKSE